MAIAVLSLSEWINGTFENNSATTFCKLIIYDLGKLYAKSKKKYIGGIFSVLYIVTKNLLSVCNILTFSKAFDSIPDFLNLGYQVEIVNQF